MLKAIIFDWAGTTLDYGCMAPADVFLKVFSQAGIDLSMEQARGPMGSHKKKHIEILLQLPDVQRQWEKKYGKAPDAEDVEKLFSEFVPLQMACLKENSTMIPGAVATIQTLRDRGMKIGSTTGYTKAMMEIVLPEAERQGYKPDFLVCADEVPAGRPEPWMCLRNAEALRVYPLSHTVKVGDTVVDVQEGLNAGMWTIGLTLCGNEVGVSYEQMRKMPFNQRDALVKKAEQRLLQAGAHYVATSLSEIHPLLEDIERRIARGERP